MRKMPNADSKIKLLPVHDWRAADADEINKCRQHAGNQQQVIITPVTGRQLFRL